MSSLDARGWLHEVQDELCASLDELDAPDAAVRRLHALHARQLQRCWSCLSEPELLALLKSVDERSEADPESRLTRRKA
jgi:hypothetical protein